MASSSVGMSYTLTGLAVTIAIGASPIHAQPATGDEQTLANLLDTYAKHASPKILLELAQTLRDTGRIADAANSYQRYLAAMPQAHEIEELLHQLDAELAVLTVEVAPHDCELSIDAGPYVAVGTTLLVHVRPGPHLIRIRKRDAVAELAVEAFAGEVKQLVATLHDAPDTAPSHPAPQKVFAWLVDGTRYSTPNAGGAERHVHAGFTGVEVAAFEPRADPVDQPRPIDELAIITPEPDHTASGIEALLRIDGKGRGFAGGLGLAYAVSDSIELELAGLRSAVWGAYAGARYRFLAGWVRPYAAAGLPMFFFTDGANHATAAFGARIAVGLELVLDDHFSLEGDLGVEHFFNISDTQYMGQQLDETIFVPTLGLIGRI